MFKSISLSKRGTSDAYLFGYFFGRHQLIALSPKKTWEGYIGGAISTCIFSIIVKTTSCS